nr:hypothetical protein [Bifidobacterium asteroides]
MLTSQTSGRPDLTSRSRPAGMAGTARMNRQVRLAGILLSSKAVTSRMAHKIPKENMNCHRLPMISRLPLGRISII